MANITAVLPLLNTKVITFPGPVWSLADNVVVKTISEAHYSAAHKFSGFLKDSVTLATKCVHFNGFENDPPDSQLRKLVLSTCYALTHFARELPPAMRFAIVVVEGAKRPKVSRLFNVPETLTGGTLETVQFKLKHQCKVEEIAALFGVCLAAYEKHPAIETTIERYFSGRAKKMFSDRVIDTAIALETLLPVASELRHQFSLYHSLISSKLESRADVYKLFQLLYDARSAIVHGEGAKAEGQLAKLQPRWDELNDYIGRSLFYYFVYLREKDAAGWQEHLRRLALGYPERLTGEEQPQ